MRLLVCLGVALALGACGSSSSTRTGDEAEVARVAESYYTALAKRDWKAVCETRAPTERDGVTRSGRSCERTLEIVIKPRYGGHQVFAEAEIRDVRVTGDVARADVVYPGQPERGTELTAVRENGRWFLKHLLGLPPVDPLDPGGEAP
jgi:hypothetical protein